jgi:transposase
MTRSGAISDELWAVVEPVMPSDVGKRGRRFGDHRLILEGIAWRDLPADLGPWQTVWKRHHRFSFDGTYQRMFDVVRGQHRDEELDSGLARLLSVDSTVVRAHQHARRRIATQGADPNYKNRCAVESDDHALGRSRGGLSTKIHAMTDVLTCAVALALTAGQAGDNPQLLPLVEGYLASAPTIDTAGDVRLIADKAYSHPSTRTALRRRGIKHTIPERDDQIARRKAKGSAGGRLPAFDAAIYKQRNTVNAASTGSSNGAE